MLSEARVRALIAGGETSEVEFKSEPRSPLGDKELTEAVVALANTSGGVLLLGVDDDGRISGARPRHGTSIDPRRLESLLSNSTRPSVGARVEIYVLEGLPVVAIEVPRAPTPVATSSGKYLRRANGGDGRPAAVPYFIFETASAAGMQDPSTVVVPGARWEDLDPLEIERMRRFIHESPNRGDERLALLSDIELCKALGAVDANGEVHGIRRLGMLLFGRPDALQRLLPTHEIAWQVLQGESVSENEFLRWPLLRVFEEISSRFRSRNRSVELVDLFRTEVPDYSPDGFREALANAMVHRDYSQLGAIHVMWTEAGIKISSPGGFPEGVHLGNLISTPPRPRNPLLADAFKRAGIVERTGRGIDTIYMGQLRYGRPMPRYEQSNATTVTVELPGGQANMELIRLYVTENRAGRNLSLSELLALHHFKEKRAMRTRELAQVMQMEESRAQDVLGRMVEAGFVEARGLGKGRTYHLSASVYRRLGDRAGYVRTRNFEPIQQEQMILQYAQKHGRIGRAEAAELCRIGPRQASYLLRRLATRHPELRKVGEKRGTRYVWLPEGSEPRK